MTQTHCKDCGTLALTMTGGRCLTCHDTHIATSLGRPYNGQHPTRKEDTMNDTRTSFTRQPENNAAFTNPGGYTITHVFQYQDDEETNDGQYTETAHADTWEAIPAIVAGMLNYPDSGGFTLAMSIVADNV